MTLAPARANPPEQNRHQDPNPLSPHPNATLGFVRALFLFDLALVAVYLGNFFIQVPSGTFLRLVDIDGETSFANWYSSVKFFSIATLFAIFAWRTAHSHGSSARLLFLLPAVFLFFSADEATQIHEWLGRKTDVLLPGGDRANTFFHVTGIWMFVLGLPFLAAFLGIVHLTRKYLDAVPGATRLLVFGIAVFLCGAIGVEFFTNYVPDPTTLSFHFQVCAEELLEMAGATFIFWAAATLAFPSLSRTA